MLKLNVPDMTCGHCASVVTKTVKSLDAGATLDVDLATQTVTVVSSVEAGKVKAALAEAGYPAEAA